MKKALIAVLALYVLFPVIASFGAGQDDIVGVWLNQEKDAKIEIFKCGEAYCGRIVWLKEPLYPEGSKEGVPGTPKQDHHNPDTALQKRPLMGLQVMQGFLFEEDNKWRGGKIYDPKNGRTYRGKITLVSPSRLDLRGYVGISLMGRTAVWTR